MDYHEIEGEDEDKRVPKGKKRKKDYRLMKVEQYVFDEITLKALYKFVQRGILRCLGGPVSAGKESIVFHAIGACEEIALKMYKVSTSNFNAMLEYIIGDPRFENIKKDRRSVVFAWARKEFKNLKRAYSAGVSVPRPIAYDKNVLVMEFIGENGVAAPRLKDVPEEILREEAERIFDRIIHNVKRLYEGKLVHADLSEFNVLLSVGRGDEDGERARTDECDVEEDAVDAIDVMNAMNALENPEEYHEGAALEDEMTAEGAREAGFEITEDSLRDAKPVLIDLGQALLLAHPRAMDFLQRDIRNITSFFRKIGLDVSYDEVYERITHS